MTAIAGACRRFFLSAALATTASFAALEATAAELPAIKVFQQNPVPECATPGRMMAFLDSQNSDLDAKFAGIATEYMRHGEALNVRWDYAFFQMMLETGHLKFKGDVKPDQNNFAGLGAIGGGNRGESFKDVSTGARAHLEHVLMYSGEKIEQPVAERTKNIQDWDVLTLWQKTIKGPMTFSQLAKKWAPTSRAYIRDMSSIADRFYAGVCKDADPKPELVAEARGAAKTVASVGKIEGDAAEVSAGKGAEIAKQAVEEARKDGDAQKSGLGASELAKAAGLTSLVNRQAPGPEVKILNPTANVAPEATDQPASTPGDASKVTEGQATVVETAALATPATGKATDGGKTSEKACHVWTASYGGAKSIIIKSSSNGKGADYTVLDVNEGSEKKEADAYISAYAKDGTTVGEFASTTEALDKAFELCPEG